jgi:CBS domain-containing protein
MLTSEDTHPTYTTERLSRQVAECTSIGILACEPETPLSEVAWLMANNSVHAVIVVRDDLPEPPVISDADLVAAAASGRFDRLTAGDVAMTEPVSVSREETLARAAQLLSEHGVAHLIVRDERRTPVGVISTLDIARTVAAGELGTPKGGPRR